MLLCYYLLQSLILLSLSQILCLFSVISTFDPTSCLVFLNINDPNVSKWTVYFNLPLGVTRCVNVGCMTDWHPITGIPASYPMFPG